MKKIGVITTTRADYGLLRPLISRLDKDPSIKLKLIASGTHFSKKFGSTYKEILKDGFKIDVKINLRLTGDEPEQILVSHADLLKGLAQKLPGLKLDALILLGDRTEMIPVALAAAACNIPVVHLCGGDITEGACDDAVRHSLTKFSSMHFTTTEDSRKRVIQMGEQPAFVLNVGSLAVESILNLKLLNRVEFEKSIGFKLGSKSALVTFHPETLKKDTVRDFDEVLKAMDQLTDYNLIFTMPNADRDSQKIAKKIKAFVKKNNRRAQVYDSLGQLRYLSAISHVDVVVGNSSSGITEVPYFGKATINIGNRQKGRGLAASVITCVATSEAIKRAVVKSATPEFVNLIAKQKMLYGNGKASELILNALKKTDTLSVKKAFYDLTHLVKA